MRLCVICEGHTEAEFVKTCLEPHLREYGINTYPSLLKTRPGRQGGGAVNVTRIIKHLCHEYPNTEAITTLVDYYGFRNRGGMSAEELEAQMLEKILERFPNTNQKRVVPYVQMYEFEALLFSDVRRFDWVVDGWNPATEKALREINSRFPNPEYINDNPETAPSKRLESIFRGFYSKTEHSPIIAEEIGLPAIRQACPRFHQWLTRLEAMHDEKNPQH
jgi:phage gpG-like protein